MREEGGVQRPRAACTKPKKRVSDASHPFFFSHKNHTPSPLSSSQPRTTSSRSSIYAATCSHGERERENKGGEERGEQEAREQVLARAPFFQGAALLTGRPPSKPSSSFLSTATPPSSSTTTPAAALSATRTSSPCRYPSMRARRRQVRTGGGATKRARAHAPPTIPHLAPFFIL